MDKVYIVTTGDYSDYRVRGVFRSEEEAERFRVMVDGMRLDEARIEEWPFSSLPEKYDGFQPWRVVLHVESGQVRVASPYLLTLGKDEEMGRVVQIDTCCLQVKMFARDEEHAVKVANEKRVRWLAERAVTQ